MTSHPVCLNKVSLSRVHPFKHVGLSIWCFITLLTWFILFAFIYYLMKAFEIKIKIFNCKYVTNIGINRNRTIITSSRSVCVDISDKDSNKKNNNNNKDINRSGDHNCNKKVKKLPKPSLLFAALMCDRVLALLVNHKTICSLCAFSLFFQNT